MWTERVEFKFTAQLLMHNYLKKENTTNVEKAQYYDTLESILCNSSLVYPPLSGSSFAADHRTFSL